MRHALAFGAAGLAALSLAACNKPASTTTSDAAQSAQSAVDKAQDTTGAAVGQASANTLGSHDTGAFVSNLTQSGMYEVQAAKIAEAKSKNPEVKAFAKMMVTDHTAMSNQMKHIFAATNTKIPTELGARGKRMISDLNAAAPADFDKLYLSQQQTTQAAELTLLSGYAEGGESTDIKPAAAKAIPKIQAHLAKVHELQAASK